MLGGDFEGVVVGFEGVGGKRRLDEGRRRGGGGR